MFTVYKRALADVEPFEYIPGDAGLAPGSAARLTGGKLVRCGAAEEPGYLIAGPARPDGAYPAARVLPTTVYETQASAGVAAAKAGAALQLNAAADGVTTAEGGAFRVTEADGSATVRGWFGPVAAPSEAAAGSDG